MVTDVYLEMYKYFCWVNYSTNNYTLGGIWLQRQIKCICLFIFFLSREQDSAHNTVWELSVVQSQSFVPILR